MSNLTPEEELDLNEPEEYADEPEDDGSAQDENAEGLISEAMRENDIHP
jgi:hypothetical protein